jgi:hypothetical protein
VTARIYKKRALRGCGKPPRPSGAQWHAAWDYLDKHPKWQPSELRIYRQDTRQWGSAIYPRPGGRPNPARRRYDRSKL